MDSQLLVLTGKKKGMAYQLKEPITIGRSQENVIILDDPKVSRKHAVIEITEEGPLLKDLNSGNGTYVGSQRITEYFLKPGDVFRVGTQLIRYEEVHQSSADTEPPVRFEVTTEEKTESETLSHIHETLFQLPEYTATKEHIQTIQNRLRAVYNANQIIVSEQNLKNLFTKIIEQIFSLLPAHNGAILLWDKRKKRLVIEHVYTRTNLEDFSISLTIVNRAFENKEAVITQNAAEDSRFRNVSGSIILHRIASAMCVPLVYQDHCLGVIYVDTRGTSRAFTQEDLEMLVAIAGPAAIALRNVQYIEMIKQSYRDTLTTIANAVELRDHYTIGHTWRVTNFAIEIAKILGWTEEKIEEVYMGGVLHDVGKIAVDDAILRKESPLTEEEFEKMKIHPVRGADLLRDISLFQSIIPYCLYHHERYDGKGYPYGLKGKEIPIEGRLIAVADTLDAMTSNRPYRKGMEPEVAIEKIIDLKETQLDPEIVDALLEAYNLGRIHSILQDYHKRDSRSIACAFCSTHIRVPEETRPGSEIMCPVCGRRLLLKESHDVLYGELLPQTDMSFTIIPFRYNKDT
ncbi:MAG TPA: HD domain-containing protein [Candidatus Hydrogenedens sp.]|nr:HD domain-containing protein [Candidatus Hydrogenedens sp.]HOK09130.1 HD domain-containing protein [Candidatus Hydrogenedens sp.]HOL20392.1 HD domain-containing protein [Candidatus Hydrogenedens sp.]HPP58897.1 HD domain-containing protein [Candidatus Hydrogenedens sp.]